MSYVIHFLDRKLGQPWEDVMDALEERAAAPDVLTRPPDWETVVTDVRELLGDVSVVENPPVWEIEHRSTGFKAGCISGEWSLSVPYWSHGDAPKRIAGRIRAVSEIVQAATGLQAYDSQVGEAVLSDGWATDQVVSVFTQVADNFKRRPVRGWRLWERGRG